VSDPATIYNNNVNCPSSGFCINGTKTQSSIVVVGRLVKHKNIKLIIEAFRDAKLDCYELSIIGSGPEEQGLRREFSDYTSVKFRGNLDSSQLQNVLVSASVFVNFSDYEGMSHAILEALSFNIPVIASEIQPNVELANLVGNEWITLVPTHDTKLLTKAIKNLASREALPSRPPSLELLCRDENAFIEEYLDILRSRFN
jgi:glycosyltransferase involved in cell wall biosynthesis